MVWHGREKLHYLNPVPLFEVSECWIRSFEHTDFRGDTEMQDSVSGGWPMVLSGLKTLLEAGFRENMVLPDEVG